MSPKNAAAVALGRRGGKAYAENTSPDDRKTRASKAAQARWAKAEKRMDAAQARIDAAIKETQAIRQNSKLRKFVDNITVGTKALEKLATKKAKQK